MASIVFDPMTLMPPRFISQILPCGHTFQLVANAVQAFGFPPMALVIDNVIPVMDRRLLFFLD